VDKVKSYVKAVRNGLPAKGVKALRLVEERLAQIETGLTG